jgi:hypothetical protein
MPSSWMLCRVAIARTDVSEKCIDSIINIARVNELGTALVVASDRSMLRRNIV